MRYAGRDYVDSYGQPQGNGNRKWPSFVSSVMIASTQLKARLVRGSVIVIVMRSLTAETVRDVGVGDS